MDDEAWVVIEAMEPQVNTMAITDEWTISPIHVELYDSGVTRHMLPYKEKFINYRAITPRPITVVDKWTFYAIGTGDLAIQVPNGANFTQVILCNTLHALDMGLTVISINQVMAAGHNVLLMEICAK